MVPVSFEEPNLHKHASSISVTTLEDYFEWYDLVNFNKFYQIEFKGAVPHDALREVAAEREAYTIRLKQLKSTW